MKRNPILTSAQARALQNGYIDPPYVLEDGEQINDFYLEPVVYENENGPAIGVTTCGVIVKDGLLFKDLDNSGKLDPYKDWRLDAETRAQDMTAHLYPAQQAGLVHNNMMNNPVVPKREMARNADGSYDIHKIIAKHDPDAKEGPTLLKGMSMTCDEKDVLERKIATGVYRGEMHMEAGMTALYVNAASQMLEFEATKGSPAIPYTLLTNPINIGYPDQLGVGAAAQRPDGLAMLHEMADTDRKMMLAAGIHGIYGPQVDVASDPRWPRNNGTYGEMADVTSDIITELVQGYQCGSDGINRDASILTVKHFPGDAPSENGFEPHMPIGQWRLYPTAGSMEKYHLPPFEAACKVGACGIMPDYSRPTDDARSTPQYYHGKRVADEAVPTAYNKGLLQDLLRGELGFTGYVNSDSGVTTAQIYGVEDKTIPERYGMLLAAGTDAIGGSPLVEELLKGLEQGCVDKADLDRATTNRLKLLLVQGRVDNPYLDPDHADSVRRENFEAAKQKAREANRKEVVLAKNHGGVLPLAAGLKIYIEAISGDNPSSGIMAQMGIGGAASKDGQDADTLRALREIFTARGYTVVPNESEADVVYLHVWPYSNGIPFVQFAMPTIELGDITVEKRELNTSQKKTGEKTVFTTLKNMHRIQELSTAAHARGAKVIATLVVNNPWILTPLEPYVDALTIQYTTSAVALDNAFNAQVDVLTGVYAPTGKLSLTMVSCPEVIAITEKELDGVVREICVSPNDVPGYDKDQYIDPAILAQVPGHSFAYCDADGNYYRAGFGLSY